MSGTDYVEYAPLKSVVLNDYHEPESESCEHEEEDGIEESGCNDYYILVHKRRYQECGRKRDELSLFGPFASHPIYQRLSVVHYVSLKHLKP